MPFHLSYMRATGVDAWATDAPVAASYQVTCNITAMQHDVLVKESFGVSHYGRCEGRSTLFTQAP